MFDGKLVKNTALSEKKFTGRVFLDLLFCSRVMKKSDHTAESITDTCFKNFSGKIDINSNDQRGRT